MPKASEIFQNAAVLLQDEDHVRWPLPELAAWLVEGIKALILAKPSACSQSIIVNLQEGTRQDLPVTQQFMPLSLVKVIRNMHDDKVGGRTISIVDRLLIDAQDPYWHDPKRTKFKDEARHYIYDEANPTEFYVWPGNTGKGKVEMVVSFLPAAVVPSGDQNELSAWDGDIGIPEPYTVPLTDYVCFRAHSKDAISGDAARAMSYYQQFATAVGLKIQVEASTSPNARRKA